MNVITYFRTILMIIATGVCFSRATALAENSSHHMDVENLPMVTEAFKDRIRVLFIENRSRLYGYPHVDFLERHSDLRFIYMGRMEAGELDTAAVTDGLLWDNSQVPLIAVERQNVLRAVMERRQFDMIFLQPCYLPPDLQEQLVTYVEEGGTLVWLGGIETARSKVKSELIEAGSLWKKLCPWERSGQKAGQVNSDQIVVPVPDHPLLAGIPFQQLLSGSRVRSGLKSRSGAKEILRWEKAETPLCALLSRGKGIVIGFNHSLLPPCVNEELDANMEWGRFWEQLGYYVRNNGQRQIVQSSITGVSGQLFAGKSIKAHLSVIADDGAQLSKETQLQVALYDRDGLSVYRTRRQRLEEIGEVAVEVSLASSLEAGFYRLESTILEGDEVLHCGSRFIEISTQTTITLSNDKPGYLIGEIATFTAAITAAVDCATGLDFVVRDTMGVAVYHQHRFLQIKKNEPVEEIFTWLMPDYGVEGWTFTAELQLTGNANRNFVSARFWRYQPWSFREKILLNSWWEPPLTPMIARQHRAIGLNATFRSEPEASRFNFRNWNLKPATRMEDYTGNFQRSDFSHLAKPPSLASRSSGNLRNISAATVLHDFGEETGWYYRWSNNAFQTWQDDSQIPEGAHLLFHSYLQQKYGSIGELNKAWETNFSAMADARLSRRYGYPPGWLHARPPAEVPGNIAPFIDTHAFFYWYLRQTAESFMTGLSSVNPTPDWGMSFSLTFNLFSPVPMTMCHPWYHTSALVPWNYQARRRSRDGDTPIFSFHWGFDEEYSGWGQFWNQSLAFNSTMITSWGSLFNNDATHSRPTLLLKRLMAQVRPREAFFLNLHLPDSFDIGFYHPDLEWQQVHSRPNFYLQAQGTNAVMMGTLGYKPTGTSWLGGPEFQVFTLLTASGYVPRHVTEEEITRCRVLFVPYVETMSQYAARQIAAFVEQGGTLVTMPVLATHDANGTPYRGVLPGGGLDKVLGLALETPLVGQRSIVMLPSDDPQLPMRFTPRMGSEPPYLWSYAYQQVASLADDTHVVLRNVDGVPMLTLHPFGKGRAIHLNAVTFGNFEMYEQAPFQEESLRQLFDNIIRSADIYPPLFVENPQDFSVAVQGWSQYQYRLANSDVRVLALYSDRTTRRLAAEVVLAGQPAAVYDILNNTVASLRYRQGEADITETDPFAFTLSKKSGSRSGYTFPVELSPGDVAFFAILPQPPARLNVTMPRDSLVAGRDTIEVNLRREQADGTPATDTWPVEVIVTDQRGHRLPMLSRRLAAGGKTTVLIPTRIGDPTGKLGLEVRDCVTGTTISNSFKMAWDPVSAALPAGRHRGLPSGQPATIELSDSEFMSLLESLQQIYRTGGLQNKAALSYYCHEYDQSRHRIMQLLHQTDWRERVKILRQHLRAGHTLILTGEDLGYDPATGLALDLLSQSADKSMDMAAGGLLPDPLPQPHVLTALEQVSGVEISKRLERQPFATRGLVIPVGRGKLILDTISLDNKGQQNGQFRTNYQQWCREMVASDLWQ